jgi:LPXTG-motif cell wall-anchored protein
MQFIGMTAGGDTVADTDPNTLATLVNPTVDGGFIPLVGISNYYWFDTNGDGVRDQGEDPVIGGTVHLLNADGTPATYPDGSPVTATTTNANGYFQFTGILPGDYRLQFDPEPGWSFTRQSNDPLDDADSNVDPSTGITPPFTVSGSETGATYWDDPQWNDYQNAAYYNPTVGAGLVQLVAMGNFTWIDIDRDGIQDPSDPVLSNVKVELFDAVGNPALDAYGNPVPALFTDAQGHYLFDGLLPGDYRVKFTPPIGYVFTEQYMGTSEEDSDADPLSGMSDVFTIDSSATGDTVADTDPNTAAVWVNPTIDAGFVPVVAVGNYTWIDTNADGLQSDGEPVISGVKVELFNPDGTPAVDAWGVAVPAQTTDANGYYLFDRLLPGDYYIVFTAPEGYRFTTQAAGDGLGIDSNPDVTTGRTPVFTIEPYAFGTTATDADGATVAVLVNPTIDAGFIAPGGALPQTGLDLSRFFLLGLGSLLAGAALMVATRRRPKWAHARR